VEDVGIFYGHLVYLFYSQLEYFMPVCFTSFMVIWYIFPILVCCTHKNLAILIIIADLSVDNQGLDCRQEWFENTGSLLSNLLL
jgi:hypothetical protein